MRILPWILILFGFHAAGENRRPPWAEHARNLIGETAGVRADAVKKLSEIFPTLDVLEKEFEGEYRHYALDVAVAMKFPGTAEKLLAQLGTDRDGSLALAVNALLDSQNHELIARRYNGYFQEHALNTIPTPVILAMVDFFTHLRKPITDPLFLTLLTYPRLEVQQSAALYFAVAGNLSKLEAIDEYRSQLYPQVRGQLLLTHFEMKDLVRTAQICTEDQDPIVQSACEGLRFKPPPPKKATKKSKSKSKPAPKKKGKK